MIEQMPFAATLKDLIELLQKFPQESNVCISINKGGSTIDSIEFLENVPILNSKETTTLILLHPKQHIK